jgi:hypothetical protein
MNKPGMPPRNAFRLEDLRCLNDNRRYALMIVGFVRLGRTGGGALDGQSVEPPRTKPEHGQPSAAPLCVPPRGLRVWHVIRVRCRTCRHMAEIAPATLSRGRPGFTRLVDLEGQLRCRKCGSSRAGRRSRWNCGNGIVCGDPGTTSPDRAEIPSLTGLGQRPEHQAIYGLAYTTIIYSEAYNAVPYGKAYIDKDTQKRILWE